MNKNFNKNFQTPILFLIFNRPDLTKKVLTEIKTIKPKKLYIAADGPRKNNKTDIERCKETRDIIKSIDWDCEIKTLFRNTNLGCRDAVSSAISWFFKNVNQGIILEDDCLPNQSFFFYCQELLDKYKDNNKVFNISGSIYQNKITNIKETYFFSKYFNCWGWATWSNRWNNYFDPEMTNFPIFLDKKKESTMLNLRIIEQKWISLFKRAYNKKADDWSLIWIFNCLYNNGVTCMPSKNLVKNIGFEKNATHTTDYYSNRANIPRTSIKFPISHPQKIKVNKKADKKNNKSLFKINFKRKLVFFLKEINLLSFTLKINKLVKNK